jgi:uncharacterized RDD family membrane protein YckC
MSPEGTETVSELVIKVNTPSYITVDEVKNFYPVTELALMVTKGISHTITVDPLHPDQWNENGQRMDLVVEGDQTIECIFTPKSNPEEPERSAEGTEIPDEPVRPAEVTGKPMQYGGFWRRLAAGLIDIVIGFVIFFVLEYLFVYLISLPGNPPTLIYFNDLVKGIGKNLLLIGEIGAFLLIIFIAYFTILESSLKQATFGKQALGLKVVDAEGQRLSPGKALIRSCSKILSGLIAGIGFFMISFADKKQGLHDYIAKTYVVKVGDEERDLSVKKSYPRDNRTLVLNPDEY